MTKNISTSFNLQDAKHLLQKGFLFNKFRDKQEEIIELVLKEEDVLAVLPTGSGKSLCFQIPALLHNNLTLVISPLIALMKDQCDALTQKGFGESVAFINSSILKEEREKILQKVKEKKIKLLYLAPETLKMQYVLEILEQVTIQRCVIDEIHCISTWGTNFRPDYLRIIEIISYLENKKNTKIPYLGLTATATRKVQNDISKVLQKEFKIVIGSQYRENLHIESIELNSNCNKDAYLFELIKKVSFPAIVFVPYQQSAENISNLLQEQGYNSAYFHAGIDDELKKEVQEKFKSNKIDIVVATIAFGMGIDKHNIRTIIHTSIPQSIENYVQEIGRAGRDGEISKCIITFSERDIWEMTRLISLSKPDLENIKSIITFLSSHKGYHFIKIRKLSMELGIDEIALNLLLKELENQKVLKIYSNVKNNFKCEKNYQITQFSIIKQKILEECPTDLKEVMEKILTISYFTSKSKKWLSIEEILNTSQLSYFKVVNCIQFLIEQEYLKCNEIERNHLFLTRFEIDDLSSENVFSYFEEEFQKQYQAIVQLSKLLRTKKCIVKEILQYFDEDINSCGSCHNCLSKKKNKNKTIITNSITQVYRDDLVPFEEIKKLRENILFSKEDSLQQIVLKSILLDPFLSFKDIPLILTGNLKKSHSKWKFNLKSHNLLPNIEINQLVKELEYCISQKYCIIDTNSMVQLTKDGLKQI